MRRALFIYIIAGAILSNAPGLGAQPGPRVTVSGRVLDKTDGQPLTDAHVYIANATLGAATDAAGYFRIEHVPLGNYHFLASRIGYQKQEKLLLIDEPVDREINFRLELQIIEIEAVVVTAVRPRKWKKHLKRFEEAFLGTSRNAKACEILNPEVLDFEKVEGGVFVAVASQPLILENHALGYRIEYDLKDFREEAGVVEFKGVARFEPLPHEPEQEHWQANRRRAYQGSLRHFLSALAADHAEIDGFLFYGVFDLGEETRPIERDDILAYIASPYEKALRIRRYIKVIYSEELEEDAYVALETRSGPLDPGDQVSWIELRQPSARFYLNGNLRDPYAVKVHGYWAWERVADMLPLDYEYTLSN